MFSLIKVAPYAVYAFIMVFEAIAIFQCIPGAHSDGFKTGPRKTHRCLDSTNVQTWMTIPSIITDIAIFTIPIPVV
ncbi:hypothetical protein OCU04_012252 [Sclerotinia nivalis]|uniref:Rhodopsin domain-containing protein n=1 Tax=Sclerotinia nivalis TaxID=352851 RepID=A0A9X0AAQ4_9HELO|nr:hypothetical protein OCU04_012252 [Sclerotinia nivalis]